MNLSEIEISHHFGGGVYAKETVIPAGVVLTQHVHLRDHLSVLASGRVAVDIDGSESELIGPCCITIKAGHAHKVTAKTEAVWYCIHASIETDPEKIDETLIV